MCIGKLGLGGDVLVAFTRLGMSAFNRGSRRWVKHVDFIILELNNKIGHFSYYYVTLKTRNNTDEKFNSKAIKHALVQFNKLRSFASTVLLGVV